MDKNEGNAIKIPGNEKLEEKLAEYLSFDSRQESLEKFQNMVNEGDLVKLKHCLEERLAFGTAGLRGRMDIGYNAINHLVIIQTSQGLASYVKATVPQATERGVVIGFDGRHNSREFADLTAAAFLNLGFKVFLFEKMVPTPFVPFTVKKDRAAAGIMITASHNPKDDNGYKVYWENGAQIVSPHDKMIQEEILKNLKPVDNAWDMKAACSKGGGTLTNPYEKTCAEYYSMLASSFEDIGSDKVTTFVYTPMHGVGLPFVQLGFESVGLKKLVPVAEQMNPDPEFPTVKFPNPEEGKSALDLAIKTANESGSSVILANDPDADRLAVAEKDNKGDWKVFTGNEIGALLGWWLLHRYRARNGDAANAVMISSTVSSKILKSMADIEGFQFLETLTGFKHMGNEADKFSKKGFDVLFAFEEAIGFMCGTQVLDKDGVSAALHMAKIVQHVEQEGMTLTSKLAAIYEKYGCHVSVNSYFTCTETEKISKFFAQIKAMYEECLSNGKTPSLKNGEYQVEFIRDLTTGLDTMQKDRKAVLPLSTGSPMITFTFTNKMVATIRASGTEPKLKYYTEAIGQPKKQSKEDLIYSLSEMVEFMIKEWVMPEKWGLELKSDDQ